MSAPVPEIMNSSCTIVANFTYTLLSAITEDSVLKNCSSVAELTDYKIMKCPHQNSRIFQSYAGQSEAREVSTRLLSHMCTLVECNIP
jgi:hypothetical protein